MSSPKGKKGSILVPMRNKKFQKPSVPKITLKRASAIMQGFQSVLYIDLQSTTSEANAGLIDIKIPLWQQLAIKILSNGHPKAYIEFFELTHQPQPPAPSPDYVDPKDVVGAKRLIDADTLNPLILHMENAEMGLREENYEEVFLANYEIANLFEEVKDNKQALFYFWRALSATEKTKIPKHIAKARFALGRVYWKLKNSQHAIQNYEDFIFVVKTAKDIASIAEATTNLLEIHVKCGEQFREDGDFPSSIKCYERAWKSASLAQNWKDAGEINYQLGLLHLKLKNYDKALEYVTEFHKYCVEVKDLVGQGKANAAMSEVFEALEQASNAVAHMEKYLNVADSVGLLTKAKAACKIGMLYHRSGDLEEAHHYFTSYYQMARESKDVKTIALARVNLGIVRAALNKSPAILVEEEQPIYSQLVSLGTESKGSDSDDS